MDTNICLYELDFHSNKWKYRENDQEAVVQLFRSQSSSIYEFVLSTLMQNKLRKKRICCLCFRVRIRRHWTNRPIWFLISVKKSPNLITKQKFLDSVIVCHLLTVRGAWVMRDKKKKSTMNESTRSFFLTF